MQVEDIIEQIQTIRGQSIEVEGYFISIDANRRKVVSIASNANIAEEDQQQIIVDHSLAELKAIIRPLPSMQLIFRGMLTNPPYIYRFPINLQVTVDINDDDKPILRNITRVEIDVPLIGKMSDYSRQNSFRYTAQVDYNPQNIETEDATARAIIQSQKRLVLSPETVNAELILETENRYARRIIGEVIRLSGWLRTISYNEGAGQIVFVTSAIRASMVAIGPLKDMTQIWLRPSPLYQLIKSHIPLSISDDLNQRVEIIGKISYIQNYDMPHIDHLPKLVFTDIHTIIIHETNLLL